MRQGKNLYYDLDTTTLDFAAYKVDGTFDADIFFDQKKMNVTANYMSYVREDKIIESVASTLITDTIVTTPLL